MVSYADDENLNEENDDLIIDEDAEEDEIAVPFEDDEDGDEEDNF